MKVQVVSLQEKTWIDEAGVFFRTAHSREMHSSYSRVKVSGLNEHFFNKIIDKNTQLKELIKKINK